MNRFFVAGTDTDVGKTLVSTALLECAKGIGMKTAALKPVAAGCKMESGQLVNEDAQALLKAMTAELAYGLVNPHALEPAIAPHIAATEVGLPLSADNIANHCDPLLKGSDDFILVEGAGGWLVPLNDEETMADIVIKLNLPVILVVGLRLGCISHALLSAKVIEADGLKIAGWVANQVDRDMPVVKENIETLTQRFDFPYLGHIPFLSNPEPSYAAKFLNIGKLLED